MAFWIIVFSVCNEFLTFNDAVISKPERIIHRIIPWIECLIVNEDIEKSVSDVEAIICAEKNKVTRYKNNIIDKFKEEL